MARLTRPAVLFILRTGDTYTVSLETPTEGPSVLAGSVTVTVQDRQDVLTALARAVGSTGAAGSFDPMALPSAGRLLYGLFLPRTVQDFLRTWAGPLAISTNDPAVPWELLHDGQAFLGLKNAVGRRLVSARTPPPPSVARREQPAFLFIADPGADLPDAASEAQQLVMTLSRRGFPCDLLLAERASYVNVQEALGTGRYDVIHYAGHASFASGDGEESALELAQDRLLPAGQIERVLRGAPLVFLNACASATPDSADATLDLQPSPGIATESLAAAFIFGGARGFIGALWPVHDAGARAFAGHFYERLLAGDPVGEALRVARQQLRQAQPADMAWTSFVLYGDPTQRLWEGATAQSLDRVAPVSTPRATVRPHAARMTPARSTRTAGVQRGRLRSVVGVLAILIVAGLFGAFGLWVYGRLSEADQRERTLTPAALVVAATTYTAAPRVITTPQPTATDTPPRPPTLQPTSSPTRRPTATALTVAQPLVGWLAFVSKVEPARSTLYVVRADGSGLRDLGSGVDPDWSPAGGRIAFAGLLEEESGIHLIDPDGTSRTRLTGGSDWQPTWSPDGRRLAFMSLRDGDREIFVVNADATDLRRISNNPWQDRHPSWSPAGDRIAFISNRTGRWQVWVMNADGSDQVQLTHNDYDSFRPVWSPDGRQVAYGVWTGSQNEVWAMGADGGDPHLVTANAVYKQEFEGYGLAWEPNPFISFVSNRTGQPQVFVVNPDGSGQRRISDMPAGAFSPAWSAP